MIRYLVRRIIELSLLDPGPAAIGELGVLFDQLPVAMVFRAASCAPGAPMRCSAG
jgi:hypothetical protein